MALFLPPQAITILALTASNVCPVLNLRERLTLNDLWAGLCLPGAVSFIFRARIFAA